MLQQNELITMLVGLGVVFYIIINKGRLRSIQGFRILVVAYMILFTGWILTIAEGFLLGTLFNVLEHLCYAASSTLVAVWCWFVLIRGKSVK